MVSQARGAAAVPMVVSSPPRSLPPQRHNSSTNENPHFQPPIAAATTTTNPELHPTIHHHNLQMERVTFHLHSRLCHFGLTHTSYRTRKIVEHMLLVVAICCAGALFLLHRTFVRNAHASSSTTTILPQAGGTCLQALRGFDPARADMTHLVILPHNLTVAASGSGIVEPKSTVVWSRGRGKEQRRRRNDAAAAAAAATTTPSANTQECPSTIESECAANLEDLVDGDGNDNDDLESLFYREWLDDQLAANTLPISYSYSTTKAYLMLPYDHFWLQDQMDIQYVLLSPTDPVCFGEPFVQFLLWNCFIGENTVLLNWLLTFPAQHKVELELEQQAAPKGYVYNPRTQWLKEIGGDRPANAKSIHAAAATTAIAKTRRKDLWGWWNKLLAKVGVFLRTSFLFFFCTTLVSFTLRETQERMLDFTRELSRRVRQSISVSDLVTTHLVQNLVFVPIMLGMMFFLIEFYHGDKFLAFSITSIVWFVEGFSLICLRSSQGLQYFPYFFFLLFLLFHVYQTAFPENGFVYVALTVVWCFMLHSMVFFWHRYELPALVLGAVSVDRPRMNTSVVLQQQQQQQQQQRPQQPPHEDNEYNNNNTSNRSLDSRSVSGAYRRGGSMGGGGASLPPGEQQEQQHPRAVMSSIDGNHLTAPLLSASAIERSTTTSTSATVGVRNTNTTSHNWNSNSNNSINAGGGTGVLSSRQSFMSSGTSSRGTSGMYQVNQEDDSSTGSHLYFMGGEVVVHRRRTTQASHSSSNGNGHGHHASNNSSELSPPTIRRGISVENISASGGAGLPPQPPILATTEVVEPSVARFIRNESNFSLLSSTSDAYAHAVHNNNNHTLAIGLDVTGRWNTGEPEDDLCDTLPHEPSMETVEASNVSSPPPKQGVSNDTSNSNNDDNDAAPSDGCYAQESSGLQSIFESKMTPRHRNTTAAHQLLQQQQQQQQQPPGDSHSELSSPSSSLSSGVQYQRRPPSFPELTRSN